MERANCGLHPLIHTHLKFNLAQDMVICQIALLAHLALQWFSKNGAHLVEHFPALGSGAWGGVRGGSENSGAGAIAFV